MKKKLFLIAALAVAAAVAAWYVLRMDQGDGMAYLTEPVTIGNITRTVNATGEVGAVQLVSVGAQVGGQIKKLHVVLGQDVKKGDLIAEIDSVPQLNQLETDKARLQSYESQLAAKKVALKIAKTKYDREMQLKKRDAASKESLEDAENAYALAKAEVTELESQIRQARIAVNTDEVNLGYTRITAPLDGTIVSVPVDEGQTVNANQTTPTIVQIADLDKMEIKIEISEGDITAVKPGMPITYTILSNPETEYKATLTSIDPGLTTLTDGSYKTTSSTGQLRLLVVLFVIEQRRVLLRQSAYRQQGRPVAHRHDHPERDHRGGRQGRPARPRDRRPVPQRQKVRARARPRRQA